MVLYAVFTMVGSDAFTCLVRVESSRLTSSAHAICSGACFVVR